MSSPLATTPECEPEGRRYAEMWIETRRWLEGARRELSLGRPQNWQPEIPLELSLVERVSRWLETEAEVAPEVDRCVAIRCSQAFWPDCSDAAKYFLGFRVRFALALVSPLVVYGDISTSVFPFPFSAPHRMLEWLLLDWWHARGRHDATRRVVEETEIYLAARN